MTWDGPADRILRDGSRLVYFPSATYEGYSELYDEDVWRCDICSALLPLDYVRSHLSAHARALEQRINDVTFPSTESLLGQVPP